MIKIAYNVRYYLKPSGLIMVRIRWNHKTQQCCASLGIGVDPDKWDNDRQRAKKNTQHNYNGGVVPSRLINASIDETSDYIHEFFAEKELQGIMPTADQLKDVLVSKMQKVCNYSHDNHQKERSVRDVFESFLQEASVENSWGPKCHFKYKQMFNLITGYCPKVKFSDIDKKFLVGWKEWMVQKGYHNHTTVKHNRNLKCFLKWASLNGVDIKPEVFAFKPKLATPLKSVIYLTMEEVELFSKFKFPESKKYLSHARDYFIFMCCTSLRYSDMASLKIASVTDGFIDTYTVKTKDKIRVPLNDQAKAIFDKYSKDNPGELLFSAPSNQKLNDYIKEAAKMAGLDRDVVVTYYVGTTRHEETYKLHEVISCHCGRRTFVCIALSLGMPPSVVMSITGHSDYQNMLPYISIGDSTAKKEMKKWDKANENKEVETARSKLNEAIADLEPQEIAKLLQMINSL